MSSMRMCPAVIFALLVGVGHGGHVAIAQGKSNLKLENVSETNFQVPPAYGTRLKVLKFRGNAVKELTVRMIVAFDGKARVAQEQVYRWEKSFADEKIDVFYLIQDGTGFDAKFKILPSISVVTRPEVVVGAKKKGELAVLDLSKDQKLGSGEGHVVGIEVPEGVSVKVSETFWGKPSPKAEVWVTDKSMDNLAEWSKGGKGVVWIVVEWKSFGDR
jgi:hypothetical protein